MKTNPKHFHIITLFPESFSSQVASSILGRAVKDKKIKIHFYNPRDFTKDKHHRVDQRPYGGGPGMVLEALPILKAVEKAVGRKKKVKKIILSATGRKLSNQYARKVIKQYEHVVLICGHYEGIDARVKKVLRAEELSIGDYILTGGEVAAQVVIDVMARQIPGVLGNFNSLEDDRISTSEAYTRPEVLKYKGKNYKVPSVLLSGHHKKIEEWKASRRSKEPS